MADKPTPEDLATTLGATVAALQALVVATKTAEDSVVRFTGAWEAMGTRSLASIMDEANELLGRMKP